MPPSEQGVLEATDRVLSRPEFAPGGETILNQIIGWIAEQFIRLLGNLSAVTGIPPGVFIAVFIAAALLCCGLLVLRILRRRKLRLTADTPAEEDPWLAAGLLAEQGEFSQALACLFLGYLRYLSSAGLILWQKGKTNMQYEQELSIRNDPEIQPFRAFRRSFNQVRYGGGDAGKADFDLWWAHCMALRERGVPG